VLVVSRLKKFTATTLAFVLAVPPIAADGAQAAAPPAESPVIVETAPPPKLDIRVGVVSPMEAGATGMVWFSVANVSLDSTSTTTPVGVRFDKLPSGVTFASMSPEASASASGWSCAASNCVHGKVTGTTVSPTVLLPGERLWGIARLTVAKDAPLTMISDQLARQLLGAAGSADGSVLERVDRYEVVASASFPDGGTTAAAEGRLAGTPASGKVKLQTFVTAPQRVESESKASWTVTIGNVGSVVAPSIAVADIVSSASLTSPTFKGDGWACDAASCTYAKGLAAGALSAPLEISGTAQKFVAGEDESGSELTENEIGWRGEVRSADFVASAILDYPVMPPAAPDLVVGIESKTGVPIAVVGEMLEVKVKVTNVGGPGKGATAKIELPTATFDSATGFDCTNAAGAAQCLVGDLGSDATVEGVVRFSLDDSDRNAIQVTATALVDGEAPSTAANNSSALPFVVRAAGEPIAALSAAVATGSTWKAGDPGVATLTPENGAQVGYVVRNVGSKAFDVGAKVAVGVSHPSSVALSSSGDWKCSAPAAAGSGDPAPSDEMIESAVDAAGAVGLPSGGGVDRVATTCEITLDASIAPDGNLPALVFDASIVEGAEQGSGVLAARIAGSATGGEPVIERLVVVDIPSADMELRATDTEAARLGDTVTLTVAVANEGRLSASPVFAVRATSALGVEVADESGWKCVGIGGFLRPATTLCSGPVLAPRSESKSVTVGLTPWADTQGEGWSYDIVLVNGTPDAESDTVKRGVVRRAAPLAIEISGPAKASDRRLPPGGDAYVPTTVSLVAKASPGDITWQQTDDSGVQVDLVTDGVSARFETPLVESPLSLSFTATVVDGKHAASDTFTVVVEPVVGYTPPDVGAVGKSVAARKLPRSVDSSGSSGARPYFTVPALSVNADSFGDGTIEKNGGETVTAVASASVPTGVSFAWSIVGGDDALVADPAVVAAAVSTSARLSFVAPSVQGSVTFRATATAGSRTASNTVTVVIGSALPGAITFDIAGISSPLVVTAGAPAVTVTATAPADTTLTWSVVREIGGPVTVTGGGTTATVGAASIGQAVIGVTAKNSLGLIVGMGAFPVIVRPALEVTSLCEVVDIASTLLGSASSLTGLDLSAELTAAAAACAGGNRIVFSGKSASLGGISITGLSGSLDLAGLRLTGGTLTFPESWPIDSLDLSVAGQGIVFPLRSDRTLGAPTATLTASFDATLTASISFLSGWEWDTSLRIEEGSFSYATLSGTGTASEEGTPSLSARGAIEEDGDVSFAVDARDVEIVDGLFADISGSIDWASSATTFSLEGNATGSWSPFNGAELSNIAVAFGTGEPTRLSGDLALTLGSSTLALEAEISVTSSTEYSVSIAAGQTGSWTPVSGFSLTGAEVSGSFERTSSGTTGSLALGLPTLAVNSRVAFKNVVVTGEFDCPEGSECAVAFDVAATLEVQTATPFTLAVTGSIDTAAQTVSITGETSSLAISSAFTLNSVSFTYSKSPSATTARLAGSAAVLGATASLVVDLNTSGNIVVTGGLTGFSPFGSSGPTVAAEVAAVVAGTGSVTWSPTTSALQALSLPAVTLPTAGVHVTAAFTAPTAFGTLLGSTGLPSTCVLRGNVSAREVTVTGATGLCDLTGRASRPSDTGEWDWDVSARFAGPFNLMTGVRLKNVAVRLQKPAAGSVSFSASGQLDLSINGGSATTFDFSVAAITESGEWTLSLGTAPGTFAFTPFTGLTLNQVSGTIRRTATSMSLDFSVSQRTGSPWAPVSGVSVSGAQVTLGATCADLTALSSCSVALGFGGTVSLAIAGSSTFALTGSFDTTAGWTITASVGSLNIASGVSITSASLTLSVPTSGAVSVRASGTFRVFSANLVASVTFSGAGLLIEATMAGDWTPFSGGPTFTDASVVFATYAIPSYDPPGAGGAQPLAANDPTLFGSVTIPTDLLTSVGLTGVRISPVGLSLQGLSTGNFELNIDIPVTSPTYLARSPSTGTVQSGMRIVSFGVRMVFANWVPSFGLYAEGGLKVPSQTAEIPVVVDFAVTVSGELSVSATLGIDSAGNQTPWRNAFGVTDLTVNNLAVSFSYQAGAPFPGFGAALSLELPGSLRSLLGMDSGVALSAVLNVSPTAFCMSVVAGSSTAGPSGPKVINLLSGGLTATYAEFTFAPLGCTVGRVTVDPGVRVGFSGRVAGVNVDVRASINTSAREFSVSVNIGAFSVGPVSLSDTTLEVFVSGSRPTSSYLYFQGGFAVGSSSVQAKVQLSSSGFSLTATASELPLVPGLVTVKSATISATVSVSSALLELSVSGNVEILRASVSANLSLRISGGRLERLSGSVSTSISIGSVLSINGSFSFNMATATPAIGVSGTITVGSLTVASVTGSITSQALSISASVNIARVFTGSVTGKLVWCNADGTERITNSRGVQVVANAGDFYFASAVGVSLPVGGFSATGEVKFGYSNGSIAAAAQPANKQSCTGTISTSGNSRAFFGSINAAFALGGSAFGGNASFTGSFETNGAVSMSASLSVNLGVASSSATLSASKTATGNYSLSFSGNATLAGVSVSLSGSFERTSGSTRFSFTGSANVNLYVASVRVSFTLSQSGATGSASIDVGQSSRARLRASLTLTLDSAGFYVRATGSVTLLTNYTASATVTIANMENSGGRWRSRSLYADVSFSLSLVSINFAITGTINNGNFDFRASASSSNSTGRIDCIVVWCKGKYEASFSLRVSNNSPYLSVSASLGLYYKTWNSWENEPGWSRIGGFDATVTLSPPSVRVTIDIIPRANPGLTIGGGSIRVTIN